MEILQKVDWALAISLLISILIHGLLLGWGLLPILDLDPHAAGRTNDNYEIDFKVLKSAEASEQREASLKAVKKTKPKDKVSSSEKASRKKEEDKLKEKQEINSKPKPNDRKVDRNKSSNNKQQQRKKQENVENDNPKSRNQDDIMETKENKTSKNKKLVRPPQPNKDVVNEGTVHFLSDFKKIQEEVQVQNTDLVSVVESAKGKVVPKFRNEDKDDSLEEKRESEKIKEEEGRKPIIDLTQGEKTSVSPPSVAVHQSLQYPEKMRKRGIEGRVKLKVLVSHSGIVQQIKIKKSSGYKKLDQAAKQTVKNWQFNPAQQQGAKVNSWIVIPIKFQLD